MLINYQCPHCPDWHSLNSWTTKDVLFFLRNMQLARLPSLEPYSRVEWIAILQTELLRRQRLER
jgi:hypothetical protein